MSRKLVGLLVTLAVAPAARAQERSAPADGQAGGSSAFEQACTDLLHGKLPPGGSKAVDALRKACDGLMDARAQAQRDAEERAELRRSMAAAPAAVPSGGQAAASGTGAGPSAAPQAGQGTAGPTQETGVLAAFEQAGRELVGRGRGLGMGFRGSGNPVRFTLLTDPIGWFDGRGVNAEMFGSLLPQVSWVGGVRYSKTDATNGSVDTFGIEAGADLYLYGRNNEGLRVGPRLETAFGRESFQSATSFGWLGLSGEVGYNFIATNGISGDLGVGLGGRVAGHRREDFSSFTGGEFGPYVKVGLGYSW